MFGKCKQPEIAHTLFQAMIDEGCVVDCEAYTALMSAYSRSGLFDKAFSILNQMKTIPDCRPDVFTYSILTKSCLQVYDFDAVKSLLSEMDMQGIRPSTMTYNTLIDAYGKAKKYFLFTMEGALNSIRAVLIPAVICILLFSDDARSFYLPGVAPEDFEKVKAFSRSLDSFKTAIVVVVPFLYVHIFKIGLTLKRTLMKFALNGQISCFFTYSLVMF